MRRLTDAWFEFNGVRCGDKHVRLMAMPKRPIPAERGEAQETPGMDGDLWKSERGARLPIAVSVECETTDGWSADELAAWLQGSGLLRFSDEPDRAYRARVTAGFDRDNKYLSFDTQIFTVRFDCQPHRYLYPAAEPTVMNAAGTVYNPGTAKSLPRLTIEGTGDMTVWIGGQQIDVTGGSVIIDSELMDCFDADGMTLANRRVTLDEFPQMAVGANDVSWSGSVTRVTIEGRWRYL